MVLQKFVLGMAVFCAVPLFAEEDVSGRLVVELNAVQAVEGACRVSFLALNGHEADLKKSVFEAVLFDDQGGVDRLTLFDFGELPAGRPRVRQFLVPDLDCQKLGHVLINGAQTCDTAEGAAPELCDKSLLLKSRIDVEVSG